MRVVVVSKPLISATYRRKLDALAALGAECIAVVPAEWREGGGRQVLEQGTGAYQLIVTPLRWNGHFHVHYYPELPRILRRIRPDLVHLDEEPFNLATFLGTASSRRLGIPSLFFSWQNIYRRFPEPVRTVEAAVYRWSVHAIAGSRDAAEVLQRKGYRNRISVAPQFGVDPDQFAPAPSPPANFTVGFLNRLIPAKAPLLTLGAFARLQSDARLLVVGDGPLRDSLAAAVSARGLDSRVTIRPRVPSTEMPDLMRTLSAVVLPSLTTSAWKEQFGRVLVEAMASGVPVIGSDSGEIPNVIGDAGIIVPEGDEAALAGALSRLHGDAELRHSLGMRGRQRVLERFTQTRVADKTYEAYRLALGM